MLEITHLCFRVKNAEMFIPFVSHLTNDVRSQIRKLTTKNHCLIEAKRFCEPRLSIKLMASSIEVLTPHVSYINSKGNPINITNISLKDGLVSIPSTELMSCYRGILTSTLPQKLTPSKYKCPLKNKWTLKISFSNI